MKVTLDLDLLQLSHLRTLTGVAVEEAAATHSKFPDQKLFYTHLERAQELHDQVDAAYTEVCRAYDEAIAYLATTAVVASF